MDGNTVYVRIQNQDTNNPPYMINNLTTYDINFRQKPNEGNKTFTGKFSILNIEIGCFKEHLID